MWAFCISAGKITRDGLDCGTAYSGHGEGKNNPKLVAVPNVGPIPPGDYDIGPANDNHPNLGPFVMALTPRKSTNTFGRSAFFIHGDSVSNPGGASHGCICMGRRTRELIDSSNDKIMRVAA